MCHFLICTAAAVGTFFGILTNARCAVVFDCAQAYSRAQNAFSITVNAISLLEKTKTLIIKLRVVSTRARPMYGHADLRWRSCRCIKSSVFQGPKRSLKMQ